MHLKIKKIMVQTKKILFKTLINRVKKLIEQFVCFYENNVFTLYYCE